MAELLRTIGSRLRSFLSVEDAVIHHGERIHKLLDQRYNRHLPEGMRIDFLANMRAILELLRMACDRLTRAERSLVAERSGDKSPRYGRDQVAQELSSLIVGGRDAFDYMYRPVSVEEYGFPRYIAETPLDLARQGEHLTEQLDLPGRLFPEPRIEGGLPLTAMAATITDKTAELRRLLSDVGKEVKMEELAHVEKERAKDYYDLLLVWGARIVESYFRMAGEKELAARVRPSLTRPGLTRGVELEEEGEAQEDDDREGTGDGESGGGSADGRGDQGPAGEDEAQDDASATQPPSGDEG